MAKISEIEGIGPSYAEKLSSAAISSTDKLLEVCGHKKGRSEIAQKTGISEGQLLKWTNMADLMRVKGVGKQFAELLEAAGVDTVKELRNRNATNLAAAMVSINAEKNLTKGAVNDGVVAGWIQQAKAMDPMISH